MNSKITQFYLPGSNLISAKGFKNALKIIFIALALTQAVPVFSQTAPPPPTYVSASPAAVCPSSPYSYLKAISPGNTIRWYTVSTGGSSIGSSASGAAFYVNVTVPTTYYAESVSPAAIASLVRTAVDVAVNTAPVITYMPPDVVASNANGQCGTIVTYPSASAIGTPTPNIIYSDSSGSNFDGGSTTVIVSAANVCATTSLSFDVTVNDVEAPGIIAPPDLSLTAPAGSNYVINPNLGSATAYDNCGILNIWNDAPAVFPAGTTLVTWTTEDYNGNRTYSTQEVFVLSSNQPPLVLSSPVSSGGNVVAENKDNTITVNWTDEENGGPYTVTFNWMDNTPNTVLTGIETKSASASHTYLQSGVYAPEITIVDGNGASTVTVFQYLSVYVTGNDFTTAGGFIDVAPGMFTANPSLVGKANFGNNCKPKASVGGFQGTMEFNFKAANLNFKSTNVDFDYLIVSGCYLALFQGTGKINGSGNYGILVAQSDKSRNLSCANKIRIKIWDKNTGSVIFDTQPGDESFASPVTSLSGGTVQIHTDNTCGHRTVEWAGNSNDVLQVTAAPNPFSGSTNINLLSESDQDIDVEIFDLSGKRIELLNNLLPNTQLNIGNRLQKGIYFVRITQGSLTQTIKVSKTE